MNFEISPQIFTPLKDMHQYSVLSDIFHLIYQKGEYSKNRLVSSSLGS